MKKILVITTCYAPKNVIGSIRVTKLSKFMHVYENEIYILTIPFLENEKIDSTLEVISSPFFHIDYSNYSFLFKKIIEMYKNRSIKRDKINIESPNNKKEKNKYGNKVKRYIKLISNYNMQKKFIKSTLKLYRGIEFDIVFSSYPDLSCHLSAMEIKKRQIARKWIADFRDPIAYRELNSTFEYKYNTYLQKIITKQADLVTYVSVDMINKIKSKEITKKKFKYLPNGFDNDDLKFCSEIQIDGFIPNHLNISYVGGLYNGKRDLSILFKIIRDLINNGDIESNKIRFYYAGKEYNVLREQASKFELGDMLVNMGYVAREDSLALQNQSDIVVVSTWNTDKDEGVIPGKIYECFLLKKPTITITNGTKAYSELGSMVKNAGLGFELNAMLEDNNEIENLKTFILEAYRASINNYKFEVDYNLEYINRFNYANITQQLIQYIEDIE